MEMVMRLTKAALGAAGAVVLLSCGAAWPASAHGLAAPVLLSADVVQQIGNKSECVSPARILVQMRAEQAAHGGKTLALVGGADQNFVDMWRTLAGATRARVTLVLAHGYEETRQGTVIDIVEFDSDGCAFSRTAMSGDDWNMILGALTRGPLVSV
jgi:hypothetical protein